MTHHYTMCGLDYVYLKSGVTKHETDYGSGISVKNGDELDRVIAGYVITSLARLRGQEVRFLRAILHHSQTELAACLGVKRITVARWEGAVNTPIPGPSDRLLRLVVAGQFFESDDLKLILELLKEINDEQPEELVMCYLPEENDESALFPEEIKRGDGWSQEKVAAHG